MADRVRPTSSPVRRATRGGTAVGSVAALDALLAVPSLHLVVDGYNVSKTGYPELPLADQRSRLVGQLGATRRADRGGGHRRVRRCRV